MCVKLVEHIGDEGQGLVEYALILLLVAAAVLLALSGFGVSLAGLYNQIVSAFPL